MQPNIKRFKPVPAFFVSYLNLHLYSLYNLLLVSSTSLLSIGQKHTDAISYYIVI